MLLRGLKSRITFTLLVLLIVAMLLVDLVAMLFWQNSLVKRELTHIENVVKLWSMNFNAYPEKRDNVDKSLYVLSSFVGISCIDIVIFDGENERSLRNTKQTEIMPLLRESYSDNTSKSLVNGALRSFFLYGENQLIQVVPLKNDNGERYIIGLILDLEIVVDNIKEKQPVILLCILVNAIVLGSVGFFRMVKYVLRPIDKLIELSAAYSNSGEFVFTSHNDESEFARLSFALNGMLGRINDDKMELKKNIQTLESVNVQLVDSQKKIARAEKLAAVGRLSAGLAHEIGNPVGIVQGYVELLENGDLTTEERSQFTSRALRELGRVNMMIQRLLGLSRKSPDGDDFVSARRVCSDAIELIRTQNGVVQIQLSTEFCEARDIVGLGYDDLYQVMVNCILNSLDAIKERGADFPGKISISTVMQKMEAHLAYINIHIADNGVGVPEGEISSVFDPFFTTKDVGKGTGLGLSISHSIIEAAGGSMEIDSVFGKKTNVTISLPVIV